MASALDPSPAPTALARYEAATAPDGWLTADGWLRLADDLAAQAGRAASMAIYHEVERGDDATATACTARADKLWDRAADCRSRVARLTRGAL